MQQPLRRLYLLYHELRPDPSQYSYVVDTRLFERHVDTIVRLREAQTSNFWPEITFDDGHISNFEYAAPVLQARNLTARFFITVGWTGKRQGYMGWPELRSLHSAGQLIGAHGWTHTLLPHCTEEELQAELKNSRLTLEDKLGTSITTMSLPGGRYNRRVLAACEQAGYTQVYTSIPKPEPLRPELTVGRINIRVDIQPAWIASLFAPDGTVLAGLNRQYRMKATAKALLGDGVYEKIWALLNRKEPESDAGNRAE